MGEERLAALIQESLSVAVKTKAIKPSKLSRVIVDTTVQPKNVTFPTDAKLLNAGARRSGAAGAAPWGGFAPVLCGVGKFALIQHQRYAHAKQFKRANRKLKTLRTYLGRVICDIARKIEGNSGLEAAFAKLLLLARRVRQSSSVNAGRRSIPCTRRRSNASARARLIGLTSSASKSPSAPRSAAPGAASSSPM